MLSVEEGATVGFSQADWEELQRLQGKFGKIRFGPRAIRPPPIQLSFLPPAEPAKPLPKAKRPKKPPDEPGYERYQMRLW
jgi:hypothetical protein